MKKWLGAFFNRRITDFCRENNGFMITGARYRFETSTFGCGFKSFKLLIKITLILLEENFGLFSGPVPNHFPIKILLVHLNPIKINEQKQEPNRSVV